MESILIFKIKIEIINPKENNQKEISIEILIKGELIKVSMGCNPKNAITSITKMAIHNRTIVKKENDFIF